MKINNYITENVKYFRGGQIEKMEPKKFESIEQLEAFLASGEKWEFGFEGFTIELLLEEFGRLRVLSRMIQNIIGIMDGNDWEDRLEEFLGGVPENDDQLAGAVEVGK